MWARELGWIEPVEAAARLGGLPSLAFLDSAMAHPTLGRFSYVAADPFGIFWVRNGRAFWNDMPEPGAPLEALRRLIARHRFELLPELPPFQGGAIGFFGYEFGWTLGGRLPPVPSGQDDAHLAFYDIGVAFNHVARRCWIVASGDPEATPEARRRHAEIRLDAFERRLRAAAGAAGPSCEAHWESDLDRATYATGVERVKSYIRDGDIYQANIARRFTARLPEEATAWQIYRQLRAANPAPFAAYLDCGARKILSSSPELFLRSDGRHVETRPIKGTARRHADPTLDAAVAACLLASLKDRAENVMIVDLLRNDLSKVCVPTSVEVPQLCGLESYAGLHHLVSSVTGTLASGSDAVDLVAATFPGGSITGAPKIRAMEIIAEIEARPRGVYCGAIGALGFDGSLDLNIAIRTIEIADGRMVLQAGGGITILSDPQAEYEETLTKARRIFAAFAPQRALAEAEA